ncbi:MAG: hypothetical protein ACF8XB_01660, partial [Planctomycetota bacterium JB042]
MKEFLGIAIAASVGLASTATTGDGVKVLKVKPGESKTFRVQGPGDGETHEVIIERADGADGEGKRVVVTSDGKTRKVWRVEGKDGETKVFAFGDDEGGGDDAPAFFSFGDGDVPFGFTTKLGEKYVFGGGEDGDAPDFFSFGDGDGPFAYSVKSKDGKTFRFPSRLGPGGEGKARFFHLGEGDGKGPRAFSVGDGRALAFGVGKGKQGKALRFFARDDHEHDHEHEDELEELHEHEEEMHELHEELAELHEELSEEFAELHEDAVEEIHDLIEEALEEEWEEVEEVLDEIDVEELIAREMEEIDIDEIVREAMGDVDVDTIVIDALHGHDVDVDSVVRQALGKAHAALGQVHGAHGRAHAAHARAKALVEKRFGDGKRGVYEFHFDHDGDVDADEVRQRARRAIEAHEAARGRSKARGSARFG